MWFVWQFFFVVGRENWMNGYDTWMLSILLVWCMRLTILVVSFFVQLTMTASHSNVTEIWCNSVSRYILNGMINDLCWSSSDDERRANERNVIMTKSFTFWVYCCVIQDLSNQQMIYYVLENDAFSLLIRMRGYWMTFSLFANGDSITSLMVSKQGPVHSVNPLCSPGIRWVWFAAERIFIEFWWCSVLIVHFFRNILTSFPISTIEIN